MLFHPSAGAIANWLGIVAAAGGVFSWLVKSTPQWFGALTWPQTVLVGLVLSLLTLLIVAIAAALLSYALQKGGVGARALKEASQLEIAIEEPMGAPPSEGALTIADKRQIVLGCMGAVAAYDPAGNQSVSQYLERNASFMRIKRHLSEAFVRDLRESGRMFYLDMNPNDLHPILRKFQDEVDLVATRWGVG